PISPMKKVQPSSNCLQERVHVLPRLLLLSSTDAACIPTSFHQCLATRNRKRNKSLNVDRRQFCLRLMQEKNGREVSAHCAGLPSSFRRCGTLVAAELVDIINGVGQVQWSTVNFDSVSVLLIH